MPLQPVNLHLTLPQIKKLQKGLSVQVPHKHIGHGKAIHMGITKAKGFHKAHHLKKGKRLQLSQQELKASGLWDNIKALGSKAIKYLTPYAKQAVKKAGHQAVSHASDYASSHLPEAIHYASSHIKPHLRGHTGAENILSGLESMAQTRATHGLDYLGNKAHMAIGSGMRKRRSTAPKKPHQVKGSPEARAHMARLRAMKKGSALMAMGY